MVSHEGGSEGNGTNVNRPNPPITESGDAKATRKRLFAAFVAGHMLAYPVTFAWAVGAIVPTLYSFGPSVLAAETPEGAARRVVIRLAAPSISLFLLAHAAALPWALDGSGGRRGMRVSLAIYAALTLAGGVFAACTWGWLYLWK